MKTIILFSSLLIFTACTRPTGDSSTVNIQMPNINSTASVSNEKNITTMGTGTHPTPTGFTGTYPINCYGVLVGGPEPEMSRSVCYRSDNSQPIRQVGAWAAGVPSGGNVSLEVPAGKDRVFYLVGFYTATGSCYDFKNNQFPSDSNISHPYILGIADKVQLDPGATKEISLNATFSSTAYYDDCKGPDFSDNGGGGGGGGSIQPATKLAVTLSDAHPAYYNCSQFMVEAQDANGNIGSILFPTILQFSGTNVANFYVDPTCNQVATTSNAHMMSYRSYFYMKTTSANTASTIVANYYSGNGSTPLATSATVNFTTGVSTPTANSLKFYLDNRYNHHTFDCIPHALGVVDSNDTGALLFATFNSYNVNLNISGVTGSYYSDPACSVPVSTLGSGWATVVSTGDTLKPLWSRFTTPGVATLSATQSTGTSCGGSACASPNYSYAIQDSPITTATQVSVNNNAIPPSPTVSVCYPIAIELYDANHNPAPQSAALSGTASITGAGSCTTNLQLYTSSSNCSTSTGGALSQTINVSASDNRALVWVKQSATVSSSCTFNANFASPAISNSSNSFFN